MTSFKASISMAPDAMGAAGERFLTNWQGTMTDARDTLLQSLKTRNPVDFWSAHFQFGMRTARRWANRGALEAECLPPEPSDKAVSVRKPAAVVIDVEAEEAADPAEVEAIAPESAPAEPEAPEIVAVAEVVETVSEAAVEPEATDGLAVPEEPAADDLQRIRGIGPAIAEKLNGQGIFTYAQLAALDDAAVAALDETLNFRGRIERDEWVAQARQLAGF
jgi:predicted flap endonuclease-1-like 5' DNA nuclease